MSFECEILCGAFDFDEGAFLKRQAVSMRDFSIEKGKIYRWANGRVPLEKPEYYKIKFKKLRHKTTNESTEKQIVYMYQNFILSQTAIQDYIDRHATTIDLFFKCSKGDLFRKFLIVQEADEPAGFFLNAAIIERLASCGLSVDIALNPSPNA